jgi:hypothetical protein
VIGRDHAGELAGRDHRDMAVGQPLDDVGRRAVGVRNLDDAANPGLVARHDEPVANMYAHDGALFLAQLGFAGAFGCPARARQRARSGLAR